MNVYRQNFYFLWNRMIAISPIRKFSVLSPVMEYELAFLSISTKVLSPSPGQAILVMAKGLVKLIVVSSAINMPEKELQLVLPLKRFSVTSNLMVGFLPGYSPLNAILGPEM